MKKFQLAGTALILVGLLASCNDQFLDQPPQGSLDGALLANEDGADAALISTYSVLDGWFEQWGDGDPWPASGSNWIWGSVTSDDAYKGSDPGDGPAITEAELFQWQPSNSHYNVKFRAVYEGVARANATLQLVNDATDIDEAAADRISGEAKFLRAHYHFDAYKMWENVPYYTEEDAEFTKPNDVDVLPLIIQDFTDAMNTLPSSQGDVGRATSWAAKAYLGKVYMFQGDYANAITQLSDVVDNGPYALMDCYHDMFNQAFDAGGNTEQILSYQSSINDGTGNGENGAWADQLNFPHAGSPFGCCGFHQPSQNLVNAFKTDADGLPLLTTFNDAAYDPATDNVDPRLDWTVGRADVPFLDWGNHTDGWVRNLAYGGPYSAKKNIPHQAQPAQGSGWHPTALTGANIPILRYADVMLMLAEAYVETGDLEAARGLVNQVRARAGNCAQGTGVDEATIYADPTDAGITWANYNVGTYDNAWTDQATARTAVRFERRIELAMEGHRFFDLRRWGTLQAVMNEYLSSEADVRNYLGTASSVEERHNLFPLPTVQIELSTVDGTVNLTQNPGW
ncbi:MAG TPA: RagB/SusD family nutrient uptake outer membrane protein [Cytophagales bacterium]|nr:RagB/SusD family nutrient uptake outer membrane protein [Cytophagales bacterium]